ncbi:MAG: pantoate--beta-alanine ligase [Alphaproteobacteria bacterium]|nr:pantoate--beta-alanine ligase [Alphaproteobacteria bacterium]
MHDLKVFRTAAALRGTIKSAAPAGGRLALVPTMGALHEGHLTLVRRARELADSIAVSIFVNPTQFGPHEDFSRYPRDEAGDLEKLRRAGADFVYCPDVDEIYPGGPSASIKAAGPALMGMENDFRPGHFDGVVTVVHRLFEQVQPALALFGEKDYQQLLTIRRMVRERALPIEIVGVDIVRESDGLALSSRNMYLTPEQRAAAPALHAAMVVCAAEMRAGKPQAKSLDAARAKIAAAGFDLQYLEARDAETLARADHISAKPARLLAAAKLGQTRLIDNIEI